METVKCSWTVRVGGGTGNGFQVEADRARVVASPPLSPEAIL